MFIDGKLNSEPAKLPERLEMPTVADMVPGSVHYIDVDALWFDETGEIWLNEAAPLEYYEDESYISRYVRVIAFEQGPVVDWTSAKDDYGNLRKVYRTSFTDHINDEHFDIGEYKKVVGFITSKKELSELKKIFKKTYGLTFKGEPVGRTKSSGKQKGEKRIKVD